MKLKVHIHKIKSIEDLTIEFPVDKGLYAITGQNGSGKSTIVASASRVFFNLPMKEYFGRTDDGAFLQFNMDDGTERKWEKNNGAWISSSIGKMNIRGFFEGSLIFGNRFRDTTYQKLKQVDKINQDKLIPADDFIRTNLGYILHGDTEFYEKLWRVSNNYVKFDGCVFYYEKNGKRISQFHMSTGENLLISILNSLFMRIRDIDDKRNCIVFLDEIELALHPSSLKRLVVFLGDIANKYNYAIYFSTHSIELISGIKPDNIFYVERHTDNSLEIINPCYPAYATKFLYDHTGYDKVILVEDDLAKEIIFRIIREKAMMNNRLIHILPSGGWTNVLKLADDVVKSNLLGKKASISVILDKDIEGVAKKYILNNNYKNTIPIGYLPISSLEKYLRDNLVISVNHKLNRLLTDYVFMQKSISEIVDDYKRTKEFEWTKDNSGKQFYARLDAELRARGSDRREIMEMVVKFLFDNEQENIEQIVSFLQEQLE